ncbi:SAM-motif ubiquitously expressed punctatedly localized protein isoform X1 [Leptinotarsa decemlineata]|uniref:SAM-motif ubiquitously expressed punctatedly localized protein isoform X1 n=3 Tax=Leptinotarsa decemlineata TaxID=7539 RepID=UPI003D30D079
MMEGSSDAEQEITPQCDLVLNCVEMIKDECDSADEVQDYPRRNGLFSITENLKHQKSHQDKSTISNPMDQYGETTSPTEVLENNPIHQSSKPIRRKRMDRTINNNGPITTPISASDYVLHNNNNHLKNERLSPGTPDTSSRSRSATPSSASHPDTPPASETPLLPLSGRNYSDFMRSLAAKYNNTNPNDYFNAARNGFPPPLDPRFKPAPFPNLLPSTSQGKDTDANNKKPDFSVLNPFASVAGVPGSSAMFPPLIDMSSTQTLLALVRTAKEAELQNLLKTAKRPDTSSPLDLSAAAPPSKRSRVKTSSRSSPTSVGFTIPKRAESESPRLHEDISNWSVDDVSNFVSRIDICAEYAQIFRDQRIDGAGLPLLTEEHLTNTMNMKLGPALKLRSILAKKLGSCSVCLHCSHCHNNSTGSPEPGTSAGNTSDSGGAS